MSISYLPVEVLGIIYHYIEVSQYPKIFSLNKDFFRVSESEDFFEDLCKVYKFDLSKRNESKETYREYFKKCIVNFKMVLMYTSIYPTRDVVLGTFKRILGDQISEKNVCFIELRKESSSIEYLKEKCNWANVILFFGGNPITLWNRNEMGDFMYDLIRKTNKSLITLMWAHGNSDCNWQMGGRWRDNNMNIIPLTDGMTIEKFRNLRSNNGKFKKMIKAEGLSENVFGYSYAYKSKKKVSPIGNLLMTLETEKDGSAIGLAERKDVKYLQANFDLNQNTIGLISRLILYIKRRNKNIM